VLEKIDETWGGYQLERAVRSGLCWQILGLAFNTWGAYGLFALRAVKDTGPSTLKAV